MPSVMTAAALLIPGNLGPAPGLAGEVFRLCRLACAVASAANQSTGRVGLGACPATSVVERDPRSSGGGAEVQGQKVDLGAGRGSEWAGLRRWVGARR